MALPIGAQFPSGGLEGQVARSFQKIPVWLQPLLGISVVRRVASPRGRGPQYRVRSSIGLTIGVPWHRRQHPMQGGIPSRRRRGRHFYYASRWPCRAGVRRLLCKRGGPLPPWTCMARVAVCAPRWLNVAPFLGPGAWSLACNVQRPFAGDALGFRRGLPREAGQM